MLGFSVIVAILAVISNCSTKSTFCQLCAHLDGGRPLGIFSSIEVQSVRDYLFLSKKMPTNRDISWNARQNVRMLCTNTNTYIYR